MNLIREVTISASPKKVYSAYADILLWQEVLDDIIDITVSYDDSLHQEFEMTVLRGNHQETVRSIRFCRPEHSIEMFQTQPPPLFKSMSGVWKFSQHDEGTLVQAVRFFEVKPDQKFDPAVLATFLEKNLSSFKRWIEKSCIK